MQGDALFQFLLARWERTDPEDRPKVFRELCAEARGAYAGDGEATAQFLGHFVSEALLTFPDIQDEERCALLVAARKAIEDSEINLDAADEDDDDHRALTTAELRKKRKEAKTEREAVLDEFNSRYAVVRDGGTALVFDDCYDDVLKRQYYDRLKPAALGLLYQTRKVCVEVDEDGKRHYQPVAKWWLNHKDRRTFVNGTVFIPGKDAKDGFLNLWRGYGFAPKAGCCEKFKAHIKDIVCAGNQIHYEYLLGWIARAVQMPSVQGEVAIVLRGDTRTGKGTFGHALRRLFGQHGMHISSSRHLVGHFNQHLRDCVLLFCDEAFFAGDKPNISTLKSLITEPVIPIEGKYVNPVQSPNLLHVLMASNDDWVVPAMIGEERFFVLDVSSARKGDHKYFGETDAELENGGYGAFLHEMLNWDISSSMFDRCRRPTVSRISSISA
jgi:phage/plasmid-associated DNA primase